MKRIYESIIQQHFAENEQMLFMAGPRQVGKTTIALAAKPESDRQVAQPFLYLNYDNELHRQVIFQGETAILEQLQVKAIRANGVKPMLVLDELHKFKSWKQFLKGFYDLHKQDVRVLVTGSAKLDIYKAGGDSLMGRYFLYRVHSLSIAEVLQRPLSSKLIHPPVCIEQQTLKNLLRFGGYPEPFLKGNQRFHTQWKRLRRQQLLREDIRDLTQVQDLAHLEMLAELLKQQVGQLMNLSNLAKAVRVSVDTIKRWIGILESFYYCFQIKPWYKNVKRSLVKEPKFYLWDWSEIQDRGAKIENFVACHLLKAVHLWTDHGYGEFELFFLRDKDKREVDFLVVREGQPWFMVEVKNSDNHAISKNLYYFQAQTGVQHAFQLALDKPYVDKNCFEYHGPVIAPLQTLLAQLV